MSTRKDWLEAGKKTISIKTLSHERVPMQKN